MAEMEPQRSCNKASFSGSGLGFHYVTRRKQVDSNRRRGGRGEHQLARELSIPHLIAIGTASASSSDTFDFGNPNLSVSVGRQSTRDGCCYSVADTLTA